ncbi:Nicotinate phosphoribosyltransferase pncB2 [Stieleria maiorica]|uniref:Nicotinate phosphoribosyltransferase n=1 Tax=Stieleria maiorica TaxID=2795974 RepID=A0A5B9MHV8_9BACT|nr:nicotinate phosphoribosyltransferase [Stieleria maiorica]QEF99165.1 Nicotinate phosphoribosyltransferase pncB2 [Stieleria maiorica]
MNPASNSLALLTDLYELTMAYGYWKCGGAERHAAFHLFFRTSPFQGGYVIAAGLGPVLDFLRSFRFNPDDIEYLGTIVGNDGRPLFEPAFLQYLAELELTLEVDAIPEGTVVFPHEPLLRVCGPILQCQLIETALLNQINYQSLVATKASRVVMAADGDAVLEFGLRRAQGIDGGLTASRAAFIGGCAATSNVLAGKRFGIPVKGTHAHSWVMSFDSEQEAFQAYADAMPNNCVFLVDTYDTLQGVRHAVQVGRRLRRSGHRMVGIRLDSGDLAWLSIEARKILDAAGFEDAVIVASNDLDERLIQSLKLQGATITVWGVGTKLVTAYDQPALGGVYKLGAIQEDGGQWQPRIKVSEQLIKTSTPGIQQVRRYLDNDGMAIADMIFNMLQPTPETCTVVDFLDTTHQTEFDANVEFVDLLQPMLRSGKFVGESPPLNEIRSRTMTQLQQFHRTVLRLDNPHRYRVGLERSLHDLKSQLVRDARQRNKAESTT